MKEKYDLNLMLSEIIQDEALKVEKVKIVTQDEIKNIISMTKKKRKGEQRD
ncbi:MAG: hypothetical protein ACD_79C01309G0003 [uncultured bacterium]|nr:MAG: hypothetical protein ACD_79C01309G0003 [uncultured bacterium]